jgi:hypothetical protein
VRKYCVAACAVNAVRATVWGVLVPSLEQHIRSLSACVADTSVTVTSKNAEDDAATVILSNVVQERKSSQISTAACARRSSSIHIAPVAQAQHWRAALVAAASCRSESDTDRCEVSEVLLAHCLSSSKVTVFSTIAADKRAAAFNRCNLTAAHVEASALHLLVLSLQL